MGDVQVPADALWGAQTARAVENFPISGQPVPPAWSTPSPGSRPPPPRSTPSSACSTEDRARRHRRGGRRGRRRPSTTTQFPIDVFQTGSGTSTNMNVNEVARPARAPRDRRRRAPQRPRQRRPVEQRHLPQRAAHRRHPRPSTATSRPRSDHLADALRAKETEFADVVKAGRTHLMDAVARDARPGVRRLRRARSSSAPSGSLVAAQATAELPLGGTAAGTGLNTPHRASPPRSSSGSASAPGCRSARRADHFEAQSRPGRRGRAERGAQGRRRQPDQDLQRPALDGARARAPGLGEIHLPDLQPGSSIMPGKVNPVIPEATLMVVRPGHRQRRDHHLRRGLGRLRAQRHAAGHGPQRPRVDRACSRRRPGCSPTGASTASRPTSSARASCAEGSPSIVTPLNRYIGYEAAAAVAKQSIKERRDRSARSSSTAATSSAASSPRSSSTRRSTCWR